MVGDCLTVLTNGDVDTQQTWRTRSSWSSVLCWVCCIVLLYGTSQCTGCRGNGGGLREVSARFLSVDWQEVAGTFCGCWNLCQLDVKHMKCKSGIERFRREEVESVEMNGTSRCSEFTVLQSSWSRR